MVIIIDCLSLPYSTFTDPERYTKNDLSRPRTLKISDSSMT